MDESLRRDAERKLRVLTETPDLDLHVRVQEHRLEGYVWWNGRRYRLMGVRDEEEGVTTAGGGDRPGPAPADG
jgi:hypothetical protein